MEGVMTDDEIRAMLADVTPGPWRITPDEEGEPALCIEGQGFDICTAWGGYNAGEADARFIAASRDLVPALLARAEAAEAGRDDLRAKLDEAVACLRRLDVGEGWAALEARATLARITGEGG
jgi:hypothetical protein